MNHIFSNRNLDCYNCMIYICKCQLQTMQVTSGIIVVIKLIVFVQSFNIASFLNSCLFRWHYIYIVLHLRCISFVLDNICITSHLHCITFAWHYIRIAISCIASYLHCITPALHHIYIALHLHCIALHWHALGFAKCVHLQQTKTKSDGP